MLYPWLAVDHPFLTSGIEIGCGIDLLAILPLTKNKAAGIEGFCFKDRLDHITHFPDQLQISPCTCLHSDLVKLFPIDKQWSGLNLRRGYRNPIPARLVLSTLATIERIKMGLVSRHFTRITGEERREVQQDKSIIGGKVEGKNTTTLGEPLPRAARPRSWRFQSTKGKLSAHPTIKLRL